jgi:hypothetical protein
VSGKIGELFGKHLEDRRVDLDAPDSAGAEVQPRKNIAAASHAYNCNVGRRLNQIGGIDDVVLQVGMLADIAVKPRDDGGGVRIDIHVVLVNPGVGLVGQSPAERGFIGQFAHSHP